LNRLTPLAGWIALLAALAAFCVTLWLTLKEG